MRRGTVAKFVLLAMVPMVAGAPIGCSSKSPMPVVYRFATNDYKFEFDGDQKRVTIGAGLMRMVRHPEDILVSDGQLRVGDREYGEVAKNDTIRVVAGKVVVNGQVRPESVPSRNGP